MTRSGSTSDDHQPGLMLGWIVLGVVLFISYFFLRHAASLFSYDAPLESIPVIPFTMIYVALGLVCMIDLSALIRSTSIRLYKPVLIGVVLLGAVFRIMQFGTEPILEDDYYRYLWDGAVSASGHSPYRYAPDELIDNVVIAPALQSLQAQAGSVLERINYPELRTIYPPAAQGGFVLAHWISPLSPDAWRAVVLLTEALMVGFVFLILRQMNRSPLWIALYWWHPLPIKEIANSLHMEPLLMLPVVVVGWQILRGRKRCASMMLALAAGVKVWPIVLAPVIWRENLNRPAKLVFIIGPTTLILGAMIFPIILSGLNQDSGFVAFAKDWSASSAVFLLSEWATGLLAFDNQAISARLLLVLIGGIGLFWLCRSKASDTQSLLHRYVLAIALLYLLLPSQTPWYFLWISPLLCLYPSRGLQLAGALIPLHYLYFYFAPLELEHYYHYGVVWLIWVPVWALLTYDGLRPHLPYFTPQVDGYAS